MIVVCPMLAVLGAGLVSYSSRPVYEAQVTMVVRPAQRLPSTDPASTGLTSDQILLTYASLMTQPPLLRSVITDLGLKTTPTDLKAKIKVTPEPSTEILDVRVQDTDRALARDIANRLVADFITQVKQFQKQENATPNT